MRAILHSQDAGNISSRSSDSPALSPRLGAINTSEVAQSPNPLKIYSCLMKKGVMEPFDLQIIEWQCKSCKAKHTTIVFPYVTNQDFVSCGCQRPEWYIMSQRRDKEVFIAIDEKPA